MENARAYFKNVTISCQGVTRLHLLELFVLESAVFTELDHGLVFLGNGPIADLVALISAKCIHLSQSADGRNQELLFHTLSLKCKSKMSALDWKIFE